jgi:deoxyadenosine/deoxycytidine kinase
MTLNYTENRIKEALRLADGNMSAAKKQIYAWLYEDHKLLLHMTRPHLNGIVSYSLSRVLARMEKSDEELLEEEASEAKYSVGNSHKMGKDLLRGFAAKDSLQFGSENESGRPLKRKAASQDHIDTIHLLAAKSREKSND